MEFTLHCFLQDLINGYKCICPSGYYGANCDQAFSCSNAPCKNGGKCTQRVGGNQYVCDCKHGWTGTFCGQAAASCAQDPCQNGERKANVNSFFSPCVMVRPESRIAYVQQEWVTKNSSWARELRSGWCSVTSSHVQRLLRSLRLLSDVTVVRGANVLIHKTTPFCLCVNGEWNCHHFVLPIHLRVIDV